jgi:hypothetical protein
MKVMPVAARRIELHQPRGAIAGAHEKKASEKDFARERKASNSP